VALDSMILGESQIPVLKELRDRLERVRAAELERALRRLRHLSPDDGAQLEQLSHTLLNKFLHQPTIALKEAARVGGGYGLLEALKRLFGLERPFRHPHDLSSSREISRRAQVERCRSRPAPLP